MLTPDTRSEGRPRTCPDIDAIIEDLFDCVADCSDILRLEALEDRVVHQIQNRRVELLKRLQARLRSRNAGLEREKRARLDDSHGAEGEDAPIRVRVGRRRRLDFTT